MARNSDFNLSVDQVDRTDIYEARLAVTPAGTDITIEFVRRDGTPRTITGPFVDMVGREGTSSRGVTVDTTAGPRTANLWAIGRMSTVHGSYSA